MDTPKQVGPFRVLRELGRGGMGGVFLAEDPRLGRKVALKILLPSRQDGSQGTVRLLKEAKAAAKLDHPNVCAIYEVGESESGAYIAMQYVEGETIDAVLARSRPSLREVVSWGVQVAEALAEAHRLGIIHRDIKPQNLMVTPKGQVKVLDFGLAKVIAHGTQPASTATLLTQEGIIMGTVPYMSPEQVKSEPLDGRSDLFSLGAVLFEAATGRRPFPAANSAELMSEILLKDPFWDGAGDHLPPELHAVLAMALQKKKADRYTSAEAMAGDLRAVLGAIQGSAGISGTFPAWTSGSDRQSSSSGLSGNALTAAVPSQGWPPPAPKPRNWWLIAGLGLAVLVPAAYVAVPALLAQHQAIDSIAILPIANSGGDPDLDYLCEGLTEQLINQLSRLPRLKVIARASILRYKGQTPDLKALAKDLGVGAVLTGRVVQKDGGLALSVELADVQEQRQLWGETLRGRAVDLQELQGSLAQELCDRLGLRLNAPEKKALAGGRVRTTPEAYQLYLKGRHYAEKWTPEDLGRAMAYFDQALEKDPKFALAHVGKANAYWGMASTFKPSGEVMPQVRAEAQKALALDPDLAEAHTALGIATFILDRDHAAAEASLRRGIELNPGSSAAHAQYGHFLCMHARKAESLRELDRAVELDPQSPNALLTRAVAFTFLREPEKAIADARRALVLAPDTWFAWMAVAVNEFQLGRSAEALSVIERAIPNGSSHALACKGYFLGRSGRMEEAQKTLIALQDLERSGKALVSPTYIAYVQLGIGRRNEALATLRLAVEKREESALGLKVDPFLDPLRGQGVFQDILKGVRLTP